MLYIIATPIGNLKDITLRALETLQSVDGVICEDTRRTSLLLSHYDIHKPMTAMNDYNEAKILDIIIERLKSGENLALVSDAGTPLISDPGYKLVRSCLENGIQVDSIPGPSSVITALILSGFPPDKFLFLGYPPEKPGHRKDLLKSLCGHPGGGKQHAGISSLKLTYILFMSPHKLLTNLEEMREIFEDIEVTLAHELTKIHQSVETKKISEWMEHLKSPKGEYILLFRLNA